MAKSTGKKTAPAAPATVETSAKGEVAPAKPDGRPVSGRVWKSKKKRTSSMGGVKQLRVGYVEQQRRKREKEAVKAIEAEMKEAKRLENEAARAKREEKKRRKEENELRSSKMQKVTNARTIKTMSKKALRHLHKIKAGK